jgi:hypothetical protein
MNTDIAALLLLGGGIALALSGIFRRDGRPRTLQALAGLLIAGGVLRLYHAAAPSLWLDEFGTYWAVHTANYAETIRRVWASVPQTTAYYSIVYAVTHTFGFSEGALRGPSVVAGLLALPAMFLFARLALGRTRPALLAALLLALTFYHMAHSVDARPYALAYLLAIGSAAAWYRLVRTGSWGAGLLFAAAAAGTIYVHWLSGLYVASQVVVGLGLLVWQRRSRGEIVRFLGFALLAALLLAPAAPKLIHDLAHASRHDWMRTQPPEALLRTLAESIADPLPACTFLLALIAHGVARLRGSGAAEATTDDRFAMVALGALFFSPIVFAGVVYVTTGEFFFVPRYLYFLSIASLPLSALLIDLMGNRRVRLTLALLTVVPCVLLMQVRPLAVYGTFKDYNVDDRWRDALSELDHTYQPGDLLLFRAGHIDEDYAAVTGDADANEFILNPISGLYNRVAYAPVVSLTKDWDPRLFSSRMDEVRQAVVRAWSEDRRVFILGADGIRRGRYYFDHLLDFLGEPNMPPFERLDVKSWGRIKMLVLRPTGRATAGPRAVSLSPGVPAAN